jgi:hypothetical protein
MANLITLTAAEERALEGLDFGFSEGIDKLTLDSLDVRGLARNRTDYLGNSFWELTPFGQEVLAAIEEPLVDYGHKVW